MERIYPPLAAVRAFEAVARHRSVRQAAIATHTSHTVVSRHVRNLEAWLGVQLLERTARGVTLTHAGESYFQGISEPLDRLAHATAALRRTPQKEELHIWAPPAFCRYVLLPRLAEIRRAMPTVQVSLRPTTGVPDLERGEADVHVAWERSAGFDGSGELIARPATFPVVGGPDRARIVARVRGPADLLTMPLLHEDSHANWRDWFRGAGLSDIPELGGIILWNGDAAIEAASLGQGVALSNQLIAAAALASGRQVRLLAHDVRLAGYYLRLRPEARRWPHALAFRAWLLEHVRQELGGETPPARPARRSGRPPRMRTR